MREELMNKKMVFPIVLGATLALIVAANTTFAQQAPPPTKPSRTAAELQRAEMQALTQSVQELNGRLEVLVDELKHFKTDLAEVTTLWRLMLSEQRLGLMEQQHAGVQSQIWDLDAQEATIRARLQNLDKEYIATGSAFISQDQARRQIRQQLERQLQQIATRRPGLSEQEQQFRDQLNQLRSKLEDLKQQVDAMERIRETQTEEHDAKEP
jgi:uncharacterized protein involved in exopolysaccharide biosynthesis